MNTIKISVVIPSKNKDDSLNNVLLALNCQTLFYEEFEVIVVDDNSKNPVKDYIQPSNYNYNLLIIRDDRSNSSAGRARNIGVESAQSTLILFLDADVILAKNALEVHLFEHQNNDKPLAVLGKVIHVELEDLWLRLSNNANWDLSEIDNVLKKIQSEGVDDIRKMLLDINNKSFTDLERSWLFFFTVNVSMKLTTFLDAGRFDEELKGKGADDIDLGYRLYQNKVLIKFCEQAIGIHQPHIRNYELEARRDRAHEFQMLKKYPFPEMEELVTYDFLIACLGEKLLHKLDSIEIPSNMQLDDFNCIQKYLGKNSILVGTLPDKFLKENHFSFILERNTKKFRDLSRSNFSCYNLLGTATPFRKEQFNHSVITPIWQVLPEELVSRLLEEQCRIAKNVILIKTAPHGAEHSMKWWEKITSYGLPYWQRFFVFPKEFSDFQYSALNRGNGTPHSPLLIRVKRKPWLKSWHET
ncbi:MAG: glycosyltransferase [Bacteroidetes bacterium]|nr:glycosyltransferase [Bacteroidota bacterium]